MLSRSLIRGCHAPWTRSCSHVSLRPDSIPAVLTQRCHRSRSAGLSTSSLAVRRDHISLLHRAAPSNVAAYRIYCSARILGATSIPFSQARSLASLVDLSSNTPTSKLSSTNPTSPSTPSLEYSRPFSDLTNLDPTILEAIQSTFGYESMSKVQHRVLASLPTRRDLLVKAKTGTGKTLAFLVAALESLEATSHTSLSSTSGEAGEFKRMGGQIGCVIVAPTRELALQISDEAQRLLNPLGWGVQYLVGGESKSKQLDRIAKEPAEFVVATPGRLKDLLTNIDFAAKIAGSRVLVLDEADTMLQLGFRLELDSILQAMPKDRQTFLFSATIDSKLDSLLEVALHQKSKDRQGPIIIDTVGAKEININLATRQHYCLAPYQSHVALVRRIINDHLLNDMELEYQESLKKPTTQLSNTSRTAQAGKDKFPGTKTLSKSSATTANGSSDSISRRQDNKIMVFLPTTRGAQLYAKVFASLSMGKELSVFEIHSAKDQRERTLTSRNFRRIKTPAVLFTSDVSARGVDYPGVGLVIQVGAPLSLDHYIHRIGRTGRGNDKQGRAKKGNGRNNDSDHHGQGILILGELDRGFIEHQLAPSPLFEVVKQEHKYDDWQSVMLGENLDRGYKKALTRLDEKLVKSAYTSFLGYNLTVGPKIGSTDRKQILESADRYIGAFGIEERPAVSTSFLERMGFMKHRIPAIEDGHSGNEVEYMRQLHEYELVDGTFPTINTRITKSPFMSPSSSSLTTSDGEEDEEQDTSYQHDGQTAGQSQQVSRKKRQEEFEQEIGLGDTEYIKVNEAEWEDFLEFKPGMPKLIEKLHSPKRMGHIGNRPSKKVSKIYSDNDGW